MLLGSFAERHLAALSEDQLDRYEALLEESDTDLFDWITRREPPPLDRDSDVLRLLIDFRFSPRPS